MKDNLYWFGPCGFVFTSPWVVTPHTVRHAAVVLLTASGDPVELATGTDVVRHNALAIAPLTWRGLRAMDVGLISIHVFPPHPCFKAFNSIPSPGVLRLDREQLAQFNADILRAYEGRLTLREAQHLFDSVVNAVVGQMPESRPCDCRVDRLHELLRESPACSLPELARELRMSYTGTSHHFSRVVGLPFRSYRLWLKYLIAAELRLRGGSLTEIAYAAGFADSSHLYRSWRASYGLSPSYAMDSSRVRVFAEGRAGELTSPAP